MAGVLTIHSTRGGGDQAFGHSWLEYRPAAGKTTTYGTWGNNPRRQGNGLFEDIELKFRSDAHRVVALDDASEQRMFARIEQYRAMGTRAWTLFHPCSAFAADVWQHATTERLEHHTGGISNPTRLAASITAMNALHGHPHQAPGHAQPGSPLHDVVPTIGDLKRQGTKASRKRSKGWSS